MAPSGTFSKNFMPRLAAVLDKQLISDVTKIHDKNLFDRPIYAGNAIATVKSNENQIDYNRKTALILIKKKEETQTSFH